MSCRGTIEKGTAKSDPIYRNRLVNMLVNRILKREKKIIGLSNYLSSPQNDLPKERNKSTTCFSSSNTSSGTSLTIRKRNLMEISWNKNKNFILDSTRIFIKAFHLLRFDRSFIFPECILIFGLILLLKFSNEHNSPVVPMEKNPMISFSENFQTNNFNEIFQFLILLCSALCIPLFVEYIECTEMALAELLLFVLTATLGGIYAKKDVRSNKAATKYLLMGRASSSILVHGFSWLYGSSGAEIELQEIVNGLINTQMYNFPGISIALIFITVIIGFKLSPAPSHQRTPYVYEGVRFARKIPTSLSISEIFHLLLEILAILSMILGNLIAITQKSMKCMLAYSSIGQIGHVIIGIIVGHSNNGYASMITYMLFYISMHLGTFACIGLFGLRTGIDNI
ncbi:hypothetical protein Cgig2_010383 [Carnegiea gigantea]|uniref:Uncharacterized protein n=1 Tax=Carnegiea gigantea TaxID=171969 RepID=A0A9Q1QEA6_9CARY|nr:hypothetical protein Cgig2_010383 [Carnegiea gigantea]